MAFVITEPCVDCKYTDCVVVCPCECIYQGENQLYIDPDDCIDCEACIPECPVEAIFSEANVPAKWTSYIDLNRTRTRELIALGNAGMTEKSSEPAGPRCRK